MDWKFTHAADFAARTVIRNALFSARWFGRGRLSTLTMPWCTYTQPEVAHVGLYERDAQARGVDVSVFTQSMAHVDRAIVDGETDGFVKVIAERRSGRILGATVVGPGAGDLISELTLAMEHGVTLGGMARVIHPYPTMADAIRKIGDQYNKSRLTPRAQRWISRYLAWRFGR